MVICKIWDADYPWDVRVEKVCHSLQQRHQVHLICGNTSRRPTYEEQTGIYIHRLPYLPKYLGKLNKVVGFPVFFNPLWLFTIWRVVRRSRAEMILVRDLPLVLAALMVGRWFGIPIVLDNAENYPAMLRDRLKYTPIGPLGRLIRHPAGARLVERLSIRLVDHMIVVVEESRDRLIQAGAQSYRLTVVRNTPRLGQWEPRDDSQALARRRPGINLVYLGNVDGWRGIDVAIRAVRYLKDAGRLARLSVIGGGPMIQCLRELAFQLGVTDRVTFMGHLPLNIKNTFSQIQSIMHQSHIGLIPHYATDAWNSTIPNKLFDYMLLGLPVVVSDAKPTARIVRAEGCGEVFRDRDVVDLARCVMALKDPQVRRRKGIKGQAAIHKYYNWNYDSRVLIETIEAVRARCAQTEKRRPWKQVLP